MARGQRKSIEEKIAEKQDLINSLNSRLEKETEELNSLLNEQKYQEIEQQIHQCERDLTFRQQVLDLFMFR